MNFPILLKEILLPAVGETLYMVFASTFFAVLLGFMPAITLIFTNENGLKPNKTIYKTLNFIINTLRSFPFLVLMIAVFPLTKLLVGKTIGTTASIIPLTLGAAPFATRVIESALMEVDKGIIEAAKAFGATNRFILYRVMLVEAFPSILNGIVLTVINVVGYSAMAGAIGGGGLGAVAINYGYYRFKTDIMIYTILILIVLVQIFQSVGNILYKRVNK